MEYLSSGDVARQLGLTPSRVRQLAAAGEIQAVRSTGVWIFTQAAVDSYRQAVDTINWERRLGRRRKGGTG